MGASKLSTRTYKGARDFFPEDKRLQNYIFSVWREVANSFGYEEYDAPILERLEIYEAKSSEELVNKQIYKLEDKAGRKLAVRPEKTPSVARMVASKISTLPKPIRWFNIGNCWRYEKPQRGRGREFYQFDCDVFGAKDIRADAEVFSIPLEVMRRLGAKPGMYELRVNNRKFVEFYLKEIAHLTGEISEKDSQLYLTAKAIDARPKISKKAFEEMLVEAGLENAQIKLLNEYLKLKLKDIVKYSTENEGAQELVEFMGLMERRGYGEVVRYSPEIMRGLDYYTGMVAEQFDLNPQNNRAMYGGGRYDNLIGIFSKETISGVGFGMGDITLIEFLKGWNLLPKVEYEVDYYVTIWPSRENREAQVFIVESDKIATAIRQAGKSCILHINKGTSITQQLSNAGKKNAKYAVILGEKELEKDTISIKNLATGTQREIKRAKFLKELETSGKR